METLNETQWDVVIASTGIDESLLALALSRSDKKVLHVDRNGYYGGAAAALSLQEAEEWLNIVNSEDAYWRLYSNASIERHDAPDEHFSEGGNTKLGFSRAYSLALAPDLIFARSTLLTTLVSAKVELQLELLAMGSWWLCNHDSKDEDIFRVPSGREDLFADHNIDAKSKRALIKFLRFVGNFEAEEDTWASMRETPFSEFLQSRFGLPPPLQQSIHALALSPHPAKTTRTDFAIPRVARYLKSMGFFGPGFGSVIPKWGGLAEFTQVGCRACAVGGGTYVLGQGISRHELREPEDKDSKKLRLQLSNGDVVYTERVVYGADNDPMTVASKVPTEPLSRSISIASSSLQKLFPSPAEGAPPPVGAVVCISLPDQQANDPPIYVMVHSSDTGECPAGQCILYTSTALPASRAVPLLGQAVSQVLQRIDNEARVLWCLQYEQRCSVPSRTQNDRAAVVPILQPDEHTIVFPPPSLDPVFDDGVIERVKTAWRSIVGPDVDDADFMRFARRGEEEADVSGGDEEVPVL